MSIPTGSSGRGARPAAAPGASVTARLEGVIARLAGPPLRLLTRCIEVFFSRRGLPATFFLLSLVVATACWVRPPISADIRSVHLSLGVLEKPEQDPDELLRGKRHIPADSAGVLALACVAGGLVLVLIRPRLLGIASGVLLCAAVVGNAALVNHPRLVERMDQEFVQRRQMEEQVYDSPAQRHLTNSGNGRLNSLGNPYGGEQPGDLLRTWNFLLYGRWFVLWALLGILCGTAGSLGRRVVITGVWAVVALALATGMCSRRLRAEAYWLDALDLETRNRPEDAAHALDRAVEIDPEFAAMQRTWLLAGKLDYRLGKGSERERYFHLYQVARDRNAPRVVALREDLPWLMPVTTDLRNGLRAPLNGSNVFAVPIDRPDRTGIADYLIGDPSAPKDMYSGNYNMDMAKKDLEIAAAIQDLTRDKELTDPTVRNAVAGAWTHVGLRFNTQSPHFSDASGLDWWRQRRTLTSAEIAFNRAAAARDPQWKGRDLAFYLAAAVGFIQREHPERVQELLSVWEPKEKGEPGVGDRAVYADILAGMGANYFLAGQSERERMANAKLARERFAKSVQTLSLPKVINTRAFHGLGGP